MHSAAGLKEALRRCRRDIVRKAGLRLRGGGSEPIQPLPSPVPFDLLEAEGWDYAIRVKGNPGLVEQIDWLTRRRPNRTPHHVMHRDTRLHHRDKSRSKASRMMAKVEFHPREVLPTVSFYATNRSLPNERGLAFYNRRGKATQYIKKGKYLPKWTCLQFDSSTKGLFNPRIA